MNLYVAFEALYPYWPGVYETLEFFTGAGFEEEQPIVSVLRLPPKGVMSESMKCRFGLDSDLEAPEELWQILVGHELRHTGSGKCTSTVRTTPDKQEYFVNSASPNSLIVGSSFMAPSQIWKVDRNLSIVTQKFS
jgi:hypothetical protein